MGRIEELIPRRDGLIRGVKLKAMSKTGISATCYWPVQKIIPFKKVDDTDCNEAIEHDDRILWKMMEVWLRGVS